MTAADVERAFASWAREVGLSQHDDEAFYHGQVDGHGVRVDDGVRASGCYPIQAWVTVENTEARGVIKREVQEDSPMRAAVREVLDEESSLARVRIDEREVALTFRERTVPGDVERIVRRIVVACRSLPPKAGVYR